MNRVQEEAFKVLVNLDIFCKEYEIEYYLSCGTLLGAIRHQGFIPWDDDVDVTMDRENYNKFVKCQAESSFFKDMNYEFQSKGTVAYYPFGFAKIRNIAVDIKEPSARMLKFTNGPWVDIFIYDKMPENLEERKAFYQEVSKYHQIIHKMLQITPSDQDKGIKRIVKSILHNINSVTYRFNPILLNALKKTEALYQKYSNTDSRLYGDIIFPYHQDFEEFNGSIIEHSQFEKGHYASFEGRMFPVYKNPDSALTNMYGDYMTLPPESERRTHGLTEDKL